MNDFTSLVKKIVGIDNFKIINEKQNYWINQINVHKEVIRHDVNSELKQKMIEFQTKFDLRMQNYRIKLNNELKRQFKNYKVKLLNKSETKLTILINREKGCYINDNLMMSIWTNKIILMKINETIDLPYLPCMVTNHILGFLSLSYVWSMYFDNLDPKLIWILKSIFTNENQSNITRTGLHPRQFSEMKIEHKDYFMKNLKLLRLPHKNSEHIRILIKR